MDLLQQPLLKAPQSRSRENVHQSQPLGISHRTSVLRTPALKRASRRERPLYQAAMRIEGCDYVSMGRSGRRNEVEVRSARWVPSSASAGTQSSMSVLALHSAMFN